MRNINAKMVPGGVAPQTWTQRFGLSLILCCLAAPDDFKRLPYRFNLTMVRRLSRHNSAPARPMTSQRRGVSKRTSWRHCKNQEWQRAVTIVVFSVAWSLQASPTDTNFSLFLTAEVCFHWMILASVCIRCTETRRPFSQRTYRSTVNLISS